MPQTSSDNRYSLAVGLVFIFNIIVGTGALTLPAAFSKAGWLLGTLSILFLAFVSFITATYIIECIACANALIKWRNIDLPRSRSVQADSIQEACSSDENTPLNPESSENYNGDNEESVVSSDLSARYYHLDTKVELGEMATMLFSKPGRVAFYAIMIIYLYGDLSIYSVAISKSTMDVICDYSPDNGSSNALPFNLPCFNATSHNAHLIGMTREKVYRLVLVAFMATLGPFVFFNVQKTKYLQLFTTIMRWLAFIVMITLAVRILIIGKGPKGNPPAVDMRGIPALFGSCVYSFMCHHSIPGMIAPIKSKKSLGIFLSLDFFLITLFYLLLALTGVFAFANLEDLYTLNFIPSNDDGFFLKLIDYFLELFPVFTLTTTFPVLAITLRNTIQNMFLNMSRLSSYNLFLRRICFPIITIIPPIIVTLFLEDVTMLVSFTGSYAGTGIQYLIPTFMVLSARKQCKTLFGPTLINRYASPFSHVFWAICIIIWSAVCVILVSLHFLEREAHLTIE